MQYSDKEEKQMEEVGVEYFNNLVSRSLFQRSSSYTQSKFVMHDLVHDLATFVSREFCFASDDNKKLKLLTSKTRHLSYIASNYHEYLRKGHSETKSLLTFIRLGQSSYCDELEK